MHLLIDSLHLLTSDTIRPITSTLLVLAVSIAAVLVTYRSSYQNINDTNYPWMLRNFLSSLSSSPAAKMAPKAPPKPTVPAAIRSAEAAQPGEGVEHATFASGCFWGTEHLFSKHYGHLPNFKAVSGYTGGHAENPTYREVCSGRTGHAEAVQLTYQTGSVGYGELVEFFYRTHDPTTVDAQGPDRGSQYRSAIFYHTPEQEKVAREVTSEVQDKYLKGRPIVTQIEKIGKWHAGEAYHQEYLDNNPGGYECPTHRFYW